MTDSREPVPVSYLTLDRTPAEWCDIYGVEIRDPDGWRGKNDPPFTRPLGLAEFYRRLGTSTTQQLNPEAWDWMRDDLAALERFEAPVVDEVHRQPDPVPNDLPHVADLVIADIRARKAHGLAEYGTPLQPRNGRRALRDLYDEILDAAQYIRQEIWERENPDPGALDSGGAGVEWGVHYPELAGPHDPYPVDWCDDLDDARRLSAESSQRTEVVHRRVEPWTVYRETEDAS